MFATINKEISKKIIPLKNRNKKEYRQKKKLKIMKKSHNVHQSFPNILVKRYCYNHRTPWLKKRNLTDINSSTFCISLFTIHFATNLNVKTLRTIRKTKRFILARKNMHFRLNKKFDLMDGNDRGVKSQYEIDLMDAGVRGENIIKMKLFSGEKEFKVNEKVRFFAVDFTFYKIYDILSDLQIGVSPDMLVEYGVSGGRSTLRIPIEIKTKVSEFSKKWTTRPTYGCLMQNALQGIALGSSVGVVLRINFHNYLIDMKNDFFVQAWYIKYNPDFIQNIMDLMNNIKNKEDYLDNPEIFSQFYEVLMVKVYRAGGMRNRNLLLNIYDDVKKLNWLL